MKILLIAMKFYGYEYDIKKTFEQFGNTVDLIYDVEKQKNRLLSESRYRKIVHGYQQKKLKKLLNQYDIIVTIVGRFLEPFFLEELKHRNPNARFILYLWDDVKRVQNFELAKEYYDYIYSFDRVDCLNYGFRFLPLFYTGDFTPSNCNIVYDLYGSFWNHSDRIEFLKKLTNNYPEFNSYFYIKMGKVTYLQTLLKGITHKREQSKFINYKSKSITREKNIDFINHSKIIVDIQFPTQKGLSLRTIEILGCKKKLITTNQDIVNYDFYCSQNICVVDRDNPIIDKEFLNTDYYPIDEAIYNKYSLTNWCKEIIK